MRSRLRNPPVRRDKTHQGSAPPLGRTVQRSPVAASTNGKTASEGPSREPRAPIRSQIVERRLIAGQKEMIAVVDPASELGIEIGAAASAGMEGGFIQDHGAAGVGERDRGREPGESCTDDMHATRDSPPRSYQAVAQHQPQFQRVRDDRRAPLGRAIPSAAVPRASRGKLRPSPRPDALRGASNAPLPARPRGSGLRRGRRHHGMLPAMRDAAARPPARRLESRAGRGFREAGTDAVEPASSARSRRMLVSCSARPSDSATA